MRQQRSNLWLGAILMTIVSLLYVPTILAAETESVSRNALIGLPVKGEPLSAKEAKLIEPACALIFANGALTHSGQTWYEKLKGSPLLDEPENIIAKGANSFHHYCFAEVAMLRYYNSVSTKEKAAYALSAAGDYGFVVDHPEYRQVGWPFLPKMYVKLGDTLLKLSRTSEAIAAYTKALNENAGYIPAYLALANFMAQSGAKAKALEYATEGLRHQPDSKSLKRRYTELGGKQPFPEPYPDPVKEPDSSQEPASTPTAENRGENSTSATPASAQAGQPNPAPEDSAVIGTPTNPYCRFCPEESK